MRSIVISMKIDSSELRALIREVLAEDMPAPHPSMGQPPASRPAASPDAPSQGLPQNNALGKFKADVNMAANAMGRVKEAMDASDTKEALRWLDKVVGFATSARGLLGTKQ